MVRVDGERCTGCGACLDVCPVDAIELTEGIAAIRSDLCTECQACVEACPEGAIQPARELVRVVEGEIVTPEHEMVVRQPAGVPTRVTQSRRLAGLGTVLAFVGREILPRVTTLLLQAWDRRQSAAASRAQQAGDAGKSNGSQAGGQRHRRRRHRGG